MPVYVEASILDLDTIYLNGGRRGYLVSIRPSVLTELLAARKPSSARASIKMRATPDTLNKLTP